MNKSFDLCLLCILLGIIIEITINDAYKIGTTNGIIAQLFSCNWFPACEGANLINMNDIGTIHWLDFSKSCKYERNKCLKGKDFWNVHGNVITINVCVCNKKIYILCNSRWHNSLDCQNK